MKNIIIVVMLLLFAGIITGCRSTVQNVPVSPVFMQANLQRTDYSVLKKVEGKSYTKSYFGGVIRIIDGHRVILWLFTRFRSEYAKIPGQLDVFPTTETRAYYQALIKAPEADMVLPHSCIYKSRGFFPFFSAETVIFTGKAIRIKSDDELKK